MQDLRGTRPARVRLGGYTDGTLDIADMFNHKIVRLDPDGNALTLAGGSGQGSEDGRGPSAFFKEPAGLALDGTGGVYVMDRGNFLVRLVR